jgi:hypothetical protein
MTQLFEITHEDIELLNDSQLTDLLRRLLHLEAARFNIAPRGINVALNIDVPDGGEDGRIQWKRGPKSTDYIPNRLTMFQCKATDMGPTDCAKELCRKRSVELKPQVEKAPDAGGSYVLFASQALTDSLITARIKKMREAIRRAGKPYADSADLHIYDANQIRDWTNHYIPAITAVWLWRGRPQPLGLQTWEYWSQLDEYQRFPYVPSDITDGYIAQLRQGLAEPRRVARIIGLSGLGKTRLALEAFRPLSPEQASPPDLHHRVVYVDAALNIPNLAATVSAWCAQGLEGILVVDNCDLRLHQQLQTHIRHPQSQLSLLTLDYNPEIASDIPTIRLTAFPDDLIKQILRQVYEHLPDAELGRIAHYAQGFPQMAVLLAKARLNEDPEMGNLRDEILLEKLLWGRRPRNDQARQAISACALFEHVGFIGDREEEYLFVAKHVAGIEADHFYRYIVEFAQRGVIDKRGRYIRVVPLPLAVRLAADWWRHCRPARARKLIATEMPGGLAEALCDRVAKLDFLPEARELVRDLCGELGPFGQAEVLQSERGSRLFRSLAEVNPEAAAQALERAFADRSREELLRVGPGRRHLVGTLEKLCCHRDTFPVAARLLLAFAAAENERWSNNATGLFQQLFHVWLSGTEAPPQERLPIIDEALASPDPYRRILAVQALEHALQTHSFARMGGAESQGSGPALEDWRPRIRQEVQEVFDYWHEVLKRLTPIALGEDELAEQARGAIASSIRGLVRYGRMEALEQAITQIVEHRGPYWPKALEQVQQTVRYLGPNIPQTGLEQLRKWQQMLQPQSIPERLRLVVSIPPWGNVEKDENGRYIDQAEERAKVLAEECARDPRPWLEHLQVVLQGEQRQASPFGYRLGQCLEEPELFINTALKELTSLPRENANPMVLASFLGSVKARDPELVQCTLDAVANDHTLCHYLLDLTRLARPALSDLQRVLHVVERGGIPVSALETFGYSSVLDHLPPKDLIAFTDQLLAYGSVGAWTALTMLFLYQHGEEERWNTCKLQFRKILIHPALNFVERAKMADLYHWQDVAVKLLEEGDGDLAQILITKITAACTAMYTYLAFDNVVQPVLQSLLDGYRDTMWPLLSDALLSDDVLAVHCLSDLLGSRFEREEGAGVLFTLPDDFLLAWCQAHPTMAPAILARVMPLLHREGENWTWRPLARAIIDRYGQQGAVLSAITENFGSFSGSGSLVPYFERQVQPLEQLRIHHIPEVRRWAGEELRYVRQQIGWESARDDEHELGLF